MALAAAILMGALLPGRVAAGEGFDPRVEAMLRRTLETNEPPTEQDQRVAERALRDWDLSEITMPDRNDRTRLLLQSIAEGRPVFGPLRDEAEELHRGYLTPEGRRERLRRGLYGPGSGVGAPAGDPGMRIPETSSAEYWFLLATCLAIMVGGLVVWGLTRARRQPDHRIYYS